MVHSLPLVGRGWITIGGSWLVVMPLVVPVFLGSMWGMVSRSPVAVAMGLLVAGVDMSAAGADATAKQREFLVSATVTTIRAAGFAVVIVRKRWVRSQVEPTATTRRLIAVGDMSTTGADATVERTTLIVSRFATPAKDQRARRLHVPIAWRAQPLGSPVDIRRARCA